ncbi:MAG: hypothetical protein LC772_12345, partial [Chloroflexi bacterium]|nr:hypothetical protein [Chloroflexota bacterium]
DDEFAAPPPDSVRWLDLDNELGIIVMDGTPIRLALPGVSSRDPRRSVWPLASVAPGPDNTTLVALYPNLTVGQTRAAARDSSSLRFAGVGWAGALLPAPGGGQQLVVGRYGGDPSTVVALSSHLGAPVAVEDGVIAGAMSTLALSSPNGAARGESISCWLNSGIRGAVDARQSDEPGAAAITNPGQDEAVISARYLSTGRSCTLTAEDGRVIFRLPPRRTLGEVHFSLAAGRTVMLRY